MKKYKDKTQLSFLTRCDGKALPKFKKRTRIKAVTKNANQIGASMFFDNLIDVETTAEVLGVAPKTVRKWISVRYIPFVKIGRRVMFRPKSLELWLNRKEIKSWL